MFQRFLITCAFLTGSHFFAHAQPDGQYFKGALKANRDKLYRGIVSNSIIGNLSLPLNDENEEAWATAFSAVNLVKYETPFVHAKITFAANHTAGRSKTFTKALLELINSDYPGEYIEAAKSIFYKAGNDDVLRAMAVHYILPKASAADRKMILQAITQRLKSNPENPVLSELNHQLTDQYKRMPALKTFFLPDYLPGQVLVFSFQRRDRNFPGLAIVRKADGSFMKNTDGSYFSVGQLARSEGNMPGYISMGNTPQGIFRMDGFDTSKTYFIGPTTNIQLTMPFEYIASHFYRDSTAKDSIWTLKQYEKFLPGNFKGYHPVYGTYYAGKAGRTEIIAHGTTIDPSLYKTTSYYPFTPSAGCLVTKEFWDDKTGHLFSSDQLLLTKAVAAAGGPHGYLIVIEIDDNKGPVTLYDLRDWLPQ